MSDDQELRPTLAEQSATWEAANPPPPDVRSGPRCGCPVGKVPLRGPNGGHPRDGHTGESRVTDWERLRWTCPVHPEAGGSLEEFIILREGPGPKGVIDTSEPMSMLRSKRQAIDAAKEAGGPRYVYKLVASVSGKGS